MHVRTLICVEQPSAKSYMLWLTSDGTSILVPSRKNEWKLGRISTLGLVPHLQARKRPWLESSITQTCHMHFAHWLLNHQILGQHMLCILWQVTSEILQLFGGRAKDPTRSEGHSQTQRKTSAISLWKLFSVTTYLIFPVSWQDTTVQVLLQAK